MKKLLLALITLASVAAKADLGAGLVYSAAQDYWSSSGVADVSSSKMTSRWGALVWIPVFPAISLRTGYLIEEQKAEMKVTVLGVTATGDATLKNSVIPLNVEVGLPVPNLYAFGGLLFANNFNIDPDGDKMKADTRLNVGAGYEVWTFAPAALLLEAEYQYGLNDISPNSNYELKTRSLGLNAIVKVGF